MCAFEEASGLSVTYKEDFNDNEEWFAKVKDSLGAGGTSAPTWWCRPSSWWPG